MMLVGVSGAAEAAAVPRQIAVPGMEYPWSAVGRLNVAGHSYCSAVLISERHVLTAAHCLWLAAEKRWWPASAVHFVPGFQGDAVLVADAKSYVVADGYRFDRHVSAADEAKDWAVIELTQPLGRQTGWLAAAPLDQPALLGHAGYRQDHRYQVTLDYGCQVLSQPPATPLLWESCEAVHGSSGGPLLAFLPGGPRVVGVVVGTTGGNGGGVTAAVSISTMQDGARFPVAAKAGQGAGIGKTIGHAPPAGGPAAPAPVETLHDLGQVDGQPATLSALAERLTKTVEEKPSR